MSYFLKESDNSQLIFSVFTRHSSSYDFNFVKFSFFFKNKMLF